MATEILYPVAYAQPYEAVHIEDAQRRRPYFCFGCDREMVMRSGDIRRPHFAHKAGFVQCEKDNTLHEAAKAFICKGFRHAVATGEEYQVRYPCKQCETHISVNVAIEGANIESEKTVVKGTRSDLVVFQPDGSPRVIIEIVVTHDLEGDTKQRYEETNYPVVTVEPSWDTLRDLLQAAIGSRILNIKTDEHRYCSDCRDTRQKRESQVRSWEGPETHRRKVGQYHRQTQASETQPQRMKQTHRRAQASGTQPRKMKQAHRLAWSLARGLVAGIGPHSERIPPLTSITHDKYGSPLNTRDQAQVMASAQKLAWLGFQQQTKRPTLFLYQTGRWEIFGDLDSGDSVPVLYALRNGERECKECLLEAVGEIFDQHGVPYRRRFEDTEDHDHAL